MPHVLFVDDVQTTVCYSAALITAGYEVQTTPSADTAMALAHVHLFDAAVLDLRLPGDDGAALCRRLRRHPATADLPILVMSALVNDTHIQAAALAGADDFLAKPASRSQLTTALNNLMAHRSVAHDAPALPAAPTTRPTAARQLLSTAGNRSVMT